MIKNLAVLLFTFAAGCLYSYVGRKKNDPPFRVAGGAFIGMSVFALCRMTLFPDAGAAALVSLVICCAILN